MKYAIVDIETNGGDRNGQKITEIAILVTDGEKEIKRYESLVNPEAHIPPYITALTGISPEMVRDAPRFFEIAKDVVLALEGCVFVAHNVSFDYGVIKKEFESLAYPFNSKRLCTVKMSRKHFPGMKSYSLGNLVEHFGWTNRSAHRAMADVEVTYELFKLMHAKENGAIVTDSHHHRISVPPKLEPERVDQLPDETGCYYFYDDHDQLMYIGKAIKIRSRVLSHFRNFQTNKGIEMAAKIARIEYTLTGSELVALLHESNEIKKHRPFYNRSQKRSIKPWGLFDKYNEDGYLEFYLRKAEVGDKPLASFNSSDSGKRYLHEVTEKYELCQTINGLYTSSSSTCLLFSMEKCRGGCAHVESADDYNARALELRKTFEGDRLHVMLVDKGRDQHEKSVVLVENGRYCGFGYTDEFNVNFGADALRSCIETKEDNKDVQRILNGYLRAKEVEKVIEL